MQQLFEMLINYWITERIMKNKRIPKIVKCSIWLIMGIPLVILFIWCAITENENTRLKWIFGVSALIMTFVFAYLVIETWRKY